MTAAALKPRRTEMHALLARTHLCHGLPESRIEELAAQAAVKTLLKGCVVYSHEEEASWFYLLAQGWVKLFRETLDGDEAVLDILPAGHVFGETALFGNGRYGASAQAVEDAVVLVLPLTALRRLIEEEPRLALNMLDSMAGFRRQQEREIEHRSLQNAPQRIGCFLLRLCDDGGRQTVTLHLPYDKTLIAARLGMKPETFSRALARLREDTGIVVQGATVHIGDVRRLADYTCGACSSTYPCEDKE